MNNYLVTGGAGFIGSHIATALLQRGDRVVIIDNLSTGLRQNVPAEAIFIEGNCEQAEIINQLNLQKFDAIYHLAGQSSGEISYDNPVLDLQANTQSTLVLVKYAVETSCPNFVYASSMSVYGDGTLTAVKESDPTIPKSFYAVGKLASEHYLRIYNSFGIKTVALRLFNVYGAGQNLLNLRQGMASIYLAQALKTSKILVKGSPERYRDFVHITDVVKAFLTAEQSAISNGIYNVCFGKKVFVKDILDIISRNLDVPPDVIFSKSTPGDQFGIFGDYSSFEKNFGFRCNIPFENGMLQMIEWAKKTIER